MLKMTDSGLVSIVTDRSTLEALLPQWSELAERCVEDCAYYAPHVVMPLLRTVASRDNTRFITVWDGNRLAAFLPVAPLRVRVPGVIPAGMAWTTDYTFSSTPLIEREDPERSAQALVAGLARLGRGEWIFPRLNAEGAACRALVAALERRQSPYRFIGEIQRASLETRLGFEEHMQKHVEAKRRRELARNRRRLEERGTVTFCSATHGPELRRAAESFLALEAGGWKGARGTALACRPETRRFAELAFGSAAEEGRVRIDQLLQNGKPIAAGVTVLAGRTGFTVKGAYDEAYAGFGAGMLLEVEVLRDVLSQRWADRLDAATDGSHAIDRLWPGRSRVADLVFSLAGHAPDSRLDMLAGALSWTQSAKRWFRPCLTRFRAA